MKTVVYWRGDQKVIPNHGVARTGEPLELPEELAKKFVASGEAEYRDTSDERAARPKKSEGGK